MRTSEGQPRKCDTTTLTVREVLDWTDLVAKISVKLISLSVIIYGQPQGTIVLYMYMYMVYTGCLLQDKHTRTIIYDSVLLQVAT